MGLRILIVMSMTLLFSPCVQAQTAADADFDGNGVVGFGDFLLFAQAYNTTQSAYDIDGSGKVDFGDFLIFASFYGQKAPSRVFWTDWTTLVSDSEVSGTMTIDSTTVDVTFNGAYQYAQISGGTNYWNPSAPYISSDVENAPSDPDIIQLFVGGSATITFSQPVRDPILALVSWNGNVVDFGVPIEILSFGNGYWGSGTPILNDTGTGFTGSGEVHGVIRLPGSYSSITFTHTSESWHGFTVGAFGLP